MAFCLGGEKKGKGGDVLLFRVWLRRRKSVVGNSFFSEGRGEERDALPGEGRRGGGS